MDNERLIGCYLDETLPLEQCHFNMYQKEDIYNRIPILVFRVSREFNNGVYDGLRKTIETFNGKLKWVEYECFFGRKVKNHIISPLEYYEYEKHNFDNNQYLRAEKYFSLERYKQLCELAIEDIPDLLEHLKNNFKPTIVLR
jgi:hypothetical protein